MHDVLCAVHDSCPLTLDAKSGAYLKKQRNLLLEQDAGEGLFHGLYGFSELEMKLLHFVLDRALDLLDERGRGMKVLRNAFLIADAQDAFDRQLVRILGGLNEMGLSYYSLERATSE